MATTEQEPEVWLPLQKLKLVQVKFRTDNLNQNQINFFKRYPVGTSSQCPTLFRSNIGCIEVTCQIEQARSKVDYTLYFLKRVLAIIHHQFESSHIT